MANLVSVGIKENKQASLSIDANVRTLDYQFYYDERVLDTDVVLADENMPRLGDSCPYNESLKLKSIVLTSTDNRMWFAACEFTAGTREILEGYAYDFRCDPILKTKVVTVAYSHDIIQGDTTLSSKVTAKDAEADLPIVVSTGNPPAEPLMGVVVNKQYSWWQIEPAGMNESIESGAIFAQIGYVNSVDVPIAGQTVKKLTGEIKSIKPERYYYRPPNSLMSELRYKVTYVIEIYNEGTSAKTLDQDYQALAVPLYVDGEAGEGDFVLRNVRLADLPENINKINLNDANDQEVNDPVKLDGTGKILIADADPVYNKFGYKTASDWNLSLNLAIWSGESINAV